MPTDGETPHRREETWRPDHDISSARRRHCSQTNVTLTSELHPTLKTAGGGTGDERDEDYEASRQIQAHNSGRTGAFTQTVDRPPSWRSGTRHLRRGRRGFSCRPPWHRPA